MVSFPNVRFGHPFHMHDMIRGQPQFVAETMRRMDRADLDGFLGRPRRIVVTGCGTSFHAATYGARVLQEAMGSAVIVQAVHAYDLAFTGMPLPKRSTVLGVSHSGSTPTTNRALHRARRAGLRTIGLCGLPGSDMESETSATAVIGSTHDRSWANTMSYTTQLTAFAELATQRGARDGDAIRLSLRMLPRSLERTLADEPRIRRLATSVVRGARVTFLGSGLDEITALEAALKIRETCSFPASGYHTEQFLHGPYLSIDRRESIVMLRSREEGARSATIRRALAASGARVTTVGDGEEVDIRLPATHRIIRPILSVVPIQFIAYFAALARRANPDIMRTDIPRLRAGVEALFH